MVTTKDDHRSHYLAMLHLILIGILYSLLQAVLPWSATPSTQPAGLGRRIRHRIPSPVHFPLLPIITSHSHPLAVGLRPLLKPLHSVHTINSVLGRVWRPRRL